ncbi:MAG: zinc-binding dehydrogenase [Streptosporangiales bacterium]|nr:zinc-binding dehydrogenase [Streptosporangiales bacterium]
MVISREWHLLARPRGWPKPEDFALVERDVPDPGDGEILVRNHYMSVDPYMRGRMNAQRTYAAPYEIGKAMYGEAVGEVVASRSDRIAQGAFVRTMAGWREAAVCRADTAEVIDPELAPLPAHLGVLGMPGWTAYVGLYDIGQPEPGETVFVSAASGAVGSIVGQLAKTHGCRVVGSVGSAAKVRYITEELGFDAGCDYHDVDLTEWLGEAAPDGVDIYFENVGGDHLQAALNAMNSFGRIVACGMISGYNEPRPGPSNLHSIVAKRLRVQGFIVRDHADRKPAFLEHVGGMLRAGKIRHTETVVDGIDNAVQALLQLLEGGHHTGKMVVSL